MEIYTPPYLFRGARPVVDDAPAAVRPGERFVARVYGPVAAARLIRPGSATHMLNTDQRSIALDLAPGPRAGTVALTVPAAAALVPPGPYLLFVVNATGVPSVGRWVSVG
jgi:hypothetical protein